MKNILFICLSVLISVAIFQDAKAMSDSVYYNLGIIPYPNHVELKANQTKLKNLKIYIDPRWQSPYFVDLIKDLPIVTFSDQKNANVILTETPSMEADAYRLEVLSNKIILKASGKTGFQYGLISLMQIVRFRGMDIFEMVIEDSPRFKYRGMHLDVARHFFTIEEIKKHLDYLTYYKYNRFHWHLTDDQGWRVEIKRYPKLQEIAAYREETLIGHYNDQPHKYDNNRYGGYYTQEQIKEVVQYAADRNIEIIPEIDIPGHSMALLSAYPELGCENKVYKAATSWGVFEDVLCPKEETFQFLNNVMDELMSLFPGQYIHIGGDECPKVAWKNSTFCQELIQRESLKDEDGLQSYFVKRVANYIQSKGRDIVGWDEILEGGLAQGAIVMSWRGAEGGIEAAKQGHDVIMTPNSHCYFDYYQSEAPSEPLSIGGFIPLEKVYFWDPIPSELKPEERKHILGGQANLWTEYIKSYNGVQYMTYARGMALTETLWSKGKNYRQFLDNLEQHTSFWKNKGANVAFHIYDLKYHVVNNPGKFIKLYFDTPKLASVHYNYNDYSFGTMAGSDTINILDSGKYVFVASKKDKRGNPLELDFHLHKGTAAKIQLETLPSSRYAGQGPYSLINGLYGSDHKYGGSEWLGYSGDDCKGILEFMGVTEINQVTFRLFKGEGQWIYLPKEIEISTSEDGIYFKSVNISSGFDTDTKVATITLPLNKVKAKYLKFDIKNYGIIPAGRQGAGYKSWLFVDEIVVE
jgi:hexosaminidase